MKDFIKKVKKMDQDNMFGLINHIMKEIGLIIKFKEKVYINGKMEENIADGGKIIACMVEDNIHGLMEECMMENILK